MQDKERKMGLKPLKKTSPLGKRMDLRGQKANWLPFRTYSLKGKKIAWLRLNMDLEVVRQEVKGRERAYWQ